MMVSIPSRIERLSVVILQLDLQNLIEVQDGFVCGADLVINRDHTCDLLSREKAFFFLRGFFLIEDTSSEVSLDDLF